MKKILLLNIFLLLSITTVFAQTDCSESEAKNAKLTKELVKKEGIITSQQENNRKIETELTKKEAIITSQLENISKLEKDISYYKETLDLMNSKISKVTKDVTFKITSATGDTNTAEVLVEGILINNGGLRSMQIYKTEAFDPKGNSLKYGALNIGLTKRVSKLFNDIPTKFTATLKGAAEGTPMIKSLMIEFISKKTGPQETLTVAFKNIPIIWN